MKKYFFILLIALLISCSKDNKPEGLVYAVSYSVDSPIGSKIDYIEYMDNRGKIIKLKNVTAPWFVNLRVRAGHEIQAEALGQVRYKDSLKIHAYWYPEHGGKIEDETDIRYNDIYGTYSSQERVRIRSRILPE